MFPYEKLKVYGQAYQISRTVYRIMKASPDIPGYIKMQLNRASLSIALNIAEATAKLTKRERRRFYGIARASAFECSTIVSFLADENEISIETRDLQLPDFVEISKMLFGLMKSLEEPG